MSRVIPFEKSFASSDKAQFWSSRNVLKPEQVYKSTKSKYLFDCKCRHCFDCSLDNVKSGKWCPYCVNKKLCGLNDCKMCYDKSFASSDKAIFWSNKNELKPINVFLNSNHNYLFDCECGHTFECSLNNVTSGGWCGYCSNPPKRLCDDNSCKQCYDKSFASSDKAIFWSNKNELKPREVFKSSSSIYLFDCDCGHTIENQLNYITSGRWCSYCVNQKLCDDNNCKQCYDKSFASSDKAIFWSNKNELKPRDVFKSSFSSICWFDCECGHTFECSLNNITSGGNWCGYCSNPPKLLCDDNNCKKCFEKSFDSVDKAKYWSRKNEFKPRYVFKSSNTKYLFHCECGHSFESVLSSITNGTWCGYCSNPPKWLCDDNNCKQCFEKSFASSDKAIFWSNKNEVKPRDVFKSSTSSKYWFKCVKGHQFDITLGHIAQGKWCRYCVNKTEQILYDKLITLYPSLQQQFKADWCKNKNKNYLPFDFVIPEIKTIIELDGRQHFEQVSNWASPEETQKNDKYKTECANKNNYSIIRLLQEDVFYNTYDWLDELKQNIQKIISEGITQNIYMCKNNEYEAYVL
jgi:hypothetical protein